MNITVNKAVPEDARGMQNVFYRTWLSTYPNKEFGVTVDDIEDRFKDAFTEETLRKRAEKISNPNEGEHVLIAKDGSEIVGVCRTLATGTENRLQAIYVLPAYQGKGVGAMLWNEARKHFDAGNDTYVAVASYNQKAIGFYAHLGFQDTGRRFSDEKFRMKSGAVIPEIEMVLRGAYSQARP